MSVCVCVCRGGSDAGRGCAGALSSRRQSVGDCHSRVPHVRAVAVARRRVRVSAPHPAQHRAQLQLHGPAGRLRPDAELRAPPLLVPGGRRAAPEPLRELSTPGQDLLLVADRHSGGGSRRR